MMKIKILFLLLFLPFLIFAQKRNYKLAGEISGLNSPAKIYLRYPVNKGYYLDSTDVDNGRFVFSGNITEPILAQLILDHNHTGYNKFDENTDKVSFYLESNTIWVHATDSIKNAKLKGSKLNDDYLQYLSVTADNEKIISAMFEALSTRTSEQKKDTAYTMGLRRNLKQALSKKAVLIHGFINKNPDSYISLVMLSVLTRDMNPDSVEQAYLKFTAKVQNTALGKRLKKEIIDSHAAKVGMQAPGFQQQDANGKQVRLSDFLGKYVLLDFWASWCAPCRAEMPNVIKAYNSFKTKNFTVLGVSLDKDKAAWLNAIKTDGLDWTQVSDLKFWDNAVTRLYGVNAIPQNYLIDPNGKIIATNLRGEELQKKLSETL